MFQDERNRGRNWCCHLKASCLYPDTITEATSHIVCGGSSNESKSPRSVVRIAEGERYDGDVL